MEGKAGRVSVGDAAPAPSRSGGRFAASHGGTKVLRPVGPRPLPTRRPSIFNTRMTATATASEPISATADPTPRTEPADSPVAPTPLEAVERAAPGRPPRRAHRSPNGDQGRTDRRGHMRAGIRVARALRPTELAHVARWTDRSRNRSRAVRGTLPRWIHRHAARLEGIGALRARDAPGRAAAVAAPSTSPATGARCRGCADRPSPPVRVASRPMGCERPS